MAMTKTEKDELCQKYVDACNNRYSDPQEFCNLDRLVLTECGRKTVVELFMKASEFWRDNNGTSRSNSSNS